MYINNEWYGDEENANYRFDNNYTLWLEHICYKDCDYYNIFFEDGNKGSECLFMQTFPANNMTYKEARIKAIEILKENIQKEINYYNNMMNLLDSVKED